MAKFTTLSLESDDPFGKNETGNDATSRVDPFRYAFLALLALNVFLAAGGASFALLYFSR